VDRVEILLLITCKPLSAVAGPGCDHAYNILVIVVMPQRPPYRDLGNCTGEIRVRALGAADIGRTDSTRLETCSSGRLQVTLCLILSYTSCEVARLMPFE
jgi:hypothetical protein